jgi:hypothetical protein
MMPGTLSDDLFETSCASTHIFYFVFRVESLDAELAAKMQEIKRCVSVRVCACVRACTCSCECESSESSQIRKKSNEKSNTKHLIGKPIQNGNQTGANVVHAKKLHVPPRLITSKN